MDGGWFEVWWDYSSRPPSLLVLAADPSSPNHFEISDPSGAVVHTTSSYEDAMFWLTEDEFTKIEGRTSLDD